MEIVSAIRKDALELAKKQESPKSRFFNTMNDEIKFAALIRQVRRPSSKKGQMEQELFIKWLYRHCESFRNLIPEDVTDLERTTLLFICHHIIYLSGILIEENQIHFQD